MRGQTAGLQGVVTGALVGGALGAFGLWFRYGPGVGLDPSAERLILGSLGVIGLVVVAWVFVRSGPVSGLLTLLTGLVAAAAVVAIWRPPLIG